MDHMLHILKTLTDKGDEAILQDTIATAAMERALHISIEAIVDVGNALIDGFIMRDPGSYVDIVEILRDEQVIGEDQAKQLTETVAFRKALVNEYTQVPAAEMSALVRRSLDCLYQFAPAVRAYLEKELF